MLHLPRATICAHQPTVIFTDSARLILIDELDCTDTFMHTLNVNYAILGNNLNVDLHYWSYRAGH